MTRGRAFSLLCGAALLGGIAAFNEMTPATQAAYLNTAAGTAQSLIDTAMAAYHGMTGASEAAAPAARTQRPGAAADASAPREGTRTADASADQPSGNPLWALPLSQLSNTRERPVFSPSRRPPPPPRPTIVAPVAIQQPVKPPEPERPKVSLLGTVIGAGTDRLAVFLETGTQNVVRLHVGDDHDGWVLRLVNAREATLVKDPEAVVLTLPNPGETPAPGLVPNFPSALPANQQPPKTLQQAQPQPPPQPAQQPGQQQSARRRNK